LTFGDTSSEKGKWWAHTVRRNNKKPKKINRKRG